MDVEAYIAMAIHAVRTEREDRYVHNLSVCPGAHDVCTVEEAAPFISGIGTRLDYHVCKTLADLRCAFIVTLYLHALTDMVAERAKYLISSSTSRTRGLLWMT